MFAWCDAIEHHHGVGSLGMRVDARGFGEGPDGLPVLLLIVDTKSHQVRTRLSWIDDRPIYWTFIWVCHVVTACEDAYGQSDIGYVVTAYREKIRWATYATNMFRLVTRRWIRTSRMVWPSGEPNNWLALARCGRSRRTRFGQRLVDFFCFFF
jgi:hypothetical protein